MLLSNKTKKKVIFRKIGHCNVPKRLPWDSVQASNCPQKVAVFSHSLLVFQSPIQNTLNKGGDDRGRKPHFLPCPADRRVLMACRDISRYPSIHPSGLQSIHIDLNAYFIKQNKQILQINLSYNLLRHLFKNTQFISFYFANIDNLWQFLSIWKF